MARGRADQMQAQALQAWVKFHRWAYQRTDGKILSRMRGKPTLLLTTTGRRSGQPHTVPLPFQYDGETMIVVGSFSGADHHPAWVLNLMANPHVTIQYLGESGPALAEILAADEREAMWRKITAQAPWYADYQQRTTREIPLVRLSREQSTSP